MLRQCEGLVGIMEQTRSLPSHLFRVTILAIPPASEAKILYHYLKVIQNDLSTYKITFTYSPHFYTKKKIAFFFSPLVQNICHQQVTDYQLGTGGPASGIHHGVCPFLESKSSKPLSLSFRQ